MEVLRLHDSVEGNHLRRINTESLKQSESLAVGFPFMQATVAQHPQPTRTFNSIDHSSWKSPVIVAIRRLVEACSIMA